MTPGWCRSTRSAASPQHFGSALAEFHQRAASWAQLWPHAMTTLSTHDTKRGEDVRARIGVLSQVPSLWAEFINRWEKIVPSPDPATGLFLLQNIFGVWPADGKVTDGLRERLHAYAEKAIREAAWHTSWNDPDTEFEGAVHGWLDDVLDGPVARELTNLVRPARVARRERRAGPEAAVTHLPRHSRHLPRHRVVGRQPGRSRQPARGGLRHPPDALKSPAAQQNSCRQSCPAVKACPTGHLLHGGYHPVLAAGAAANHVVAFRRGDDVLVAVTRWTVHLEQSGWDDTASRCRRLVDRCR